MLGERWFQIMGGVKLYPKTDQCYSNDLIEKVGEKDLKWAFKISKTALIDRPKLSTKRTSDICGKKEKKNQTYSKPIYNVAYNVSIGLTFMAVLNFIIFNLLIEKPRFREGNISF